MAAPKAPSLHQQVIEQFCAAFFAQQGRDYHVTVSDRSQVGRFLSPAKPGTPPSPALLVELPAIFARFTGTDDEFHQKNMNLAYLLTKALNAYRAGKPLLKQSVRDKAIADSVKGHYR